MDVPQNSTPTSSSINGRIHLILFLIILFIICGMGIVQYVHTEQKIKNHYEHEFTQHAQKLNQEIDDIRAYLTRLHFLAQYALGNTDTLFLQELSRSTQGKTVYDSSKSYHYFRKDELLLGHPITGTISGADTINSTDVNYMRRLHMALTLLPVQEAMHVDNPAITLSYFIANSYDFSHIYPPIPLESLLTEFKSFRHFQKDAFSVYDDFSPPSVNPQKEMFWTNPYIDRAGNGIMVTCGIPLYDKEVYIGVIGVDIKLNFLKRFTSKDEKLPGELFISTESGHILAASPGNVSSDTIATLPKGFYPTPDNAAIKNKGSVHTVHAKDLFEAPWYFFYKVDKKTLQKESLKEFEIVANSIALILILLPLAYFFIFHHIILPAQLNEKAVEKLNRELDQKVIDRTKELQDREENLRLTLNAIGDAVIVTNEEGLINRMNPIAEKLVGQSAKLAIGKKLQHIFHIKRATTGEDLPSPITKILEDGELVELHQDTLLSPAKGKEFPIAHSGAPIKNSAGQIVGAILVFRDMSEEHEMQRNLQNLRNYLQNIIDSMPSMLIGVNVHGKVTQWNKMAADLTGISALNAKEKELVTLLPQLADKLERVTHSIHSREVYKWSETGLFQDLHIAHDELTIYPLKSQSIQGAVIRVDDISEKITLEGQLLQSRKMDAIGQLSGGIAHDFNNMLNGIMVSAEMLSLDLADSSEDIKESIDIIMKAASQASDLSCKLLTFGRQSANEKTDVDLAEIVDETRSILSRTIDRKIAITVVNKTEQAMILGDKSALQNVLMNLGINASHAMPNGGLLHFHMNNRILTPESCKNREFSLEPGSYVELTIRDTGVGIAPAILDKIFDPFFTTKKVGKGTGLGLSVSYGTIKEHHGAITVNSTVGEGTLFTILLPCLTEQQKKKTVEQQTVLNSSKKTLLLVDDEELIIETTGRMLERQGYTVLYATSGGEAINVFREHYSEISCVLMDIIMPDISGTEAFLKMKEIAPNCKVILCSGFTKNENLTETFDQGLWKFIPKPYSRNTILSALEEL